MEKANIFVMILTIILAVGLIAVTFAKPQVVTVGAGSELNKLRLALVGAGSVKEVTTTSFNVYPDYNYDYETGRSTANGYRVTHNLKIATEKVAAVGKIEDVATANGASTIDYVRFSLDDDKTEHLKKQDITSAASKAREKAKNLATASGVTL